MGCSLLLNSEGKGAGASGTRGTEDSIGAGYTSHAHGNVERGVGGGRGTRAEVLKCSLQGWRQIKTHNPNVHIGGLT